MSIQNADQPTQIEVISAVLCLAADEYTDAEPPTHLYLARTDGDWEIIFLRDLYSDPLDTKMTRWGDVGDAEKYFNLVRSGGSSKVAVGIASDWNPQWDD